MKRNIIHWSAALLLACASLWLASCRERDAIVIRLSDDITGTWNAVYNDDGDYVLLVFEQNGSGYYRRMGTGPKEVEHRFTYIYDSKGASLHVVTNEKEEEVAVLSLTTYSLALQGWPYNDNWIFVRKKTSTNSNT